MACFLVSTAEAIVTTVAEKVIEKKERKAEGVKAEGMNAELAPVENSTHIPFSRKLKWLKNMLWGGSALLAFEHLWHGEIVPWFPFLTAASDPADAAEMLHEMATVGVAMALLITGVWGVMVAVSAVIEKRAAKEEQTAPVEN